MKVRPCRIVQIPEASEPLRRNDFVPAERKAMYITARC